MHASWPIPTCITSWSVESLGGRTNGALGAPASTAWGATLAANGGVYIPFTMTNKAVAKRLYCVNGATATGNVDMALYDFYGARLVSIGPTAQSGTSQPQFFDITDQDLIPGDYYLALSTSSASSTFSMSSALTVGGCRAAGCFYQASVGTLPASATFAAYPVALVPLIGVEFRKVL